MTEYEVVDQVALTRVGGPDRPDTRFWAWKGRVMDRVGDRVYTRDSILRESLVATLMEETEP